jgi:hypothetical protein
MERLSLAYQAERPGLEMADPTGLVLRALSVLCLAAARRAGAGSRASVANVAGFAGFAGLPETTRYAFVTSSNARVAAALANQEEVGIDINWTKYSTDRFKIGEAAIAKRTANQEGHTRLVSICKGC